MRLTLTVTLLLMLVSLTAISYHPGSGRIVDTSQRAFHLAYHTSSDDLHFYGSADWAVRFDFANYYLPNLTERSFRIDALRLWFPQTGDSVKVKLMTDVDGQPGLPQLADLRVPVGTNQLVLTLPEPVTVQLVWLLVEYQTNLANRFVPASRGGGTRSYYLNTSMGTPYYQSFANAGFAAELLFGVEGEFIDVNDLRLMDLSLEGEIEPGATVYPSFSIHNHSGQTLNSASLQLNLLTPDQDANQTLIIPIPGGIAPYGDFVWDASQPSYLDQAITLPGQAMQMRLRGTLSGGPPSDVPGNNVIDRYYYTFIDTPPVHLVENFIRLSHIATVITLEDQVLGDDQFRNVHPLDYYPVLADSLSAPGAMARFSWYGSNATPLVVLGGTRRIPGFSAAFASDFTADSADLITDKSFISAGAVTSNFSGDSVDFRFSFENTQTSLLSGTGVYDLVAGSVLCAGVFKHVIVGGMETWVFDRWITHALPLTQGLNLGETLEVELSIPRTGLEVTSQYRTYYWIQVAGGGRVLWAGFQDLVIIPSSANDGLLPAPDLKAAPNPLRGRAELTIELAGVSAKAQNHLRIYNLRGQLVFKTTLKGEKIQLPAAVFPASGIYFIQIKGLAGQKDPLQARITVIK